MRAIVIDARQRTVNEAEIDGSLASLQGVVGGLIDPVYPGLEGTGHHCYVNDEGLLNNPQHFFMLTDGHQPLAGNAVILSTTGEGDEAPCSLPLHWVKKRVTFMDVQAVREWAAREADQEAFASFVGEGGGGEKDATNTYTAFFYTDANWASEEIEAATPEGALALAREMDQNDQITSFEHYDQAPPVNHIEIFDEDHSEVAEWQDDELRLRLAAPALLQALLDIRDAYQRHFDAMPVAWQTYDTIAETAIAKATGRDDTNAEITDSKAAKKAALADTRAETEQSIAEAQERGRGNSR